MVLGTGTLAKCLTSVCAVYLGLYRHTNVTLKVESSAHETDTWRFLYFISTSSEDVRHHLSDECASSIYDACCQCEPKHILGHGMCFYRDCTNSAVLKIKSPRCKLTRPWTELKSLQSQSIAISILIYVILPVRRIG